ncbi:TPA: hypothetical protein DEO28_02350 [Candidatus Dependentiae bacterium]|nr:MAG: hypothetical protein UR14_C0008G0040 [candidate division TM6 bacterium GW2011_GWE2_31_21]KKP53234.1 MAG: hypothetical protein UR43_C0006G0017 [candidate division TM6 bacterium GW2011_GWF2_33_332]HBS48067.1 hypothetical protein [Candidatus Dependentiae bacterium]HBZ73330.1 hypothetical protein [Candidatus Dependentiae bacterium]
MQNKFIFYKFTLLILVFGTFFSCGRKPRNIFVFRDKKQDININSLYFPAIKCLSLQIVDTKRVLEWGKLEPSYEIEFNYSNHPKNEFVKKNVILVGYNVYRFPRNGFANETPINRKPIKENLFQESPSKKYLWCYFVRGVFDVDGKIFVGPASKIICEKCSK